MVWAHRFWLRLQTLFRRDRITQRLDDEIQFHLDQQIAENISAGMNVQEARYAAMRTFGNPTFLKEKARDTWGWLWLEQFAQDVRFGARLLLHSPLFTAVVVLSLALGIGSNAAIFSIVDALMLRQLPVTAPDQLVLLSQRTAQEADYAWSYPLYEQFRDHVDALAGVLCIAGGGKTRATFHSVVSDSQPELVERQDVSGGYWSVLGVRAAVGRMFTEEDDQLGDPHDVAVISYAFWKNRFDLDPHVIGRTFILYNTPFTIIGVAPLQFRGTQPDEQPQIWVPVTTRKHLRPGFRAFTEHGSSWLTVIARLRPTATSAQVRAQLDTLFQVDHREQLRRWGSQLTPQQLAEEQTRHVEVESGANGFSWNRDRYSRSLYVLLTIGGLVLLIACVNVATLLLARAAARRREIAVRISIGAGRWRLCRQLLTESVLLSVAAGALSVVVAIWGSRMLVGFASGDEPLKLNLAPDWRMFAFVTGLVIVTGILFGVAPALRSTRMDMSPVLKPATSGILVADKLGLRLDKSLIVAQVALALLLVTTAALFIRTLEKLRSVDTGFDHDHVLLFSLDLGPSYEKLAVRWGLYHRILAELQRLPGTVAASFSMIPYLSHSSWTDNLIPDGYVRGKDEDVECYGVTVGPDFARAAGLKLLAGRDFGLEDQPQHPPAEPKPGVGPQLPPVVIVSESLARYYFGQQDPLGRYLHFDSPDAEAPQGRMRIIGVVNDTSYRSLRDPKPRAFYIPFFQTAGGFGDDPTFFVRTYGSPDAISATVQKLVSRIDARIQATETHTMRHMIDRDTLQERVLATLSAFLSGFALLLVSLGVYGVTAFSVTRRTGEIGIRMALGAQSGNVQRMVLGEVAVLVAMGGAAGVPLALGLAGLLRSQLFGVGPRDPAALVSAISVMLAVALAAAWIPARRAARVDPMVALRYE
ncbi:MAG TPA: ABC transporter permease [Terriglobales bacterium]|nr:ABC transporter permease [Terriglobales bacterium]